MKARLLIVIFLGFSTGVGAETLTLVKRDNGVTVSLHDVKWKREDSDKEFKSGLATPMLIQLLLKAGETVVSRRNAILRVTYDLWDEVYVIDFDSPQTKSRKLVKELTQVYSYMNEIPLPLIPLSELSAQEKYIVELWILGSPIDKAKFEMMRKWVAQHAVSTPSESGESVQGGSSGNRLNSLFRGLLNKNLDSEGISGRWEIKSKTMPFSLGDLK